MNIDISLFKHGYHADMNKTYFVGTNIDENAKKLVDCTRRCLDNAIKLGLLL